MSIEYDGSDKPIIGVWERDTLPAAPAPTEQAVKSWQCRVDWSSDESVTMLMVAAMKAEITELRSALVQAIAHSDALIDHGRDKAFDLAEARATPSPAPKNAAPLAEGIVTGELFYRAIYEHEGGQWVAVEPKYIWRDAANRLNNLLATTRGDSHAAPTAKASQ